MAFELVGRIKLVDKMSGPLAKVTRSVKAMDDTTKRANASVNKTADLMKNVTSSAEKAAGSASKMGKQMGHVHGNTEKAASSMHKMSNHAGHASGGIWNMYAGALKMSAVMGLIAATAAPFLAVASSIKSAANAEMTKVTTTALFKGDAAKAAAYFDFIEKRAVESMFSQDDFMATGRSFVPLTKNLDNLKALTNLAERLAASDPAQGLEGAALALRELASGDTISLAERFELPKSTLNTIKNLPIDKQIKAMDTLLNSMGFTNKLLEDQSKTTLGQYSQAVDKVKLSLQRMGMGALEKLRPMLERFNKALDSEAMKRFTAAGADMMARFFGGLVSVTERAAGKFAAFVRGLNNDEEFRKLTWDQKLVEVVDRAFTALNNWLENNDEAINRAMGNFAKIGVKLGTALGSAVIDGIMGAIESNKTASTLLGAAIGGTVGGPVGALVGGGVGFGANTLHNASPFVQGEKYQDSVYDFIQRSNAGDPNKPLLGETTLSGKVPTKRAGGLDRVPYNGFPIIAHKDERLQTKAEADEYRSGRRGGGDITINVHASVRQDSDIDAIARSLARELMGLQGAVAY